MTVERSWNDVRDEQIAKQIAFMAADTTKARSDEIVAREYKKAKADHPYRRPKVDWSKILDES